MFQAITIVEDKLKPMIHNPVARAAAATAMVTVSAISLTIKTPAHILPFDKY